MARACSWGAALVAACGSGNKIVDDPDGSVANNCGEGATQCGSACVPLARDPQNCGMCGKACAMGEVCSQGMCASSCGGGTSKCGNECVDTQSDARNCGMCGKACAMGEVCTMGSCALGCGGGTSKCGMSCVNLQSDHQLRDVRHLVQGRGDLLGGQVRPLVPDGPDQVQRRGRGRGELRERRSTR